MTDEEIGLGNRLFRIATNSRTLLFRQGELAQLSHSSFHDTIEGIKVKDDENIEISYPVGYKPSKESIISTHPYTKDELIARYEFLTHTQLPISGIFQLSMIMEVMFSSFVREIIQEIPSKISSKRQVAINEVLKVGSIEELHISLTDKIINELGFKSPREFAEEAEQYLSVNLLECSAYHHYIEMKATRDILIHSYGVVNQTYLGKAGAHARARLGQELPINQVYFLESYEACLQVTEWLEEKLHSKWYSSEYIESKKINDA